MKVEYLYFANQKFFTTPDQFFTPYLLSKATYRVLRYVNFGNQEGLDKSFQLKYQNKILTVQKKLSDVNYELVDNDGKTFVTHYNHLKKVFVRDDGEETENQPVRRSNRNRRVPARLRDYDLQADERSLD